MLRQGKVIPFRVTDEDRQLLLWVLIAFNEIEFSGLVLV
jgi:hypothetical protein